MKQVVKEAMGDYTVEEFRFLVRCQECGGIMAQQSHPLFQNRRGTGIGGYARSSHALRARREAAREKAAAGGRRDFSKLLSGLRQAGVRPMLSDLRGSGSCVPVRTNCGCPAGLWPGETSDAREPPAVTENYNRSEMEPYEHEETERECKRLLGRSLCLVTVMGMLVPMAMADELGKVPGSSDTKHV